MTQYAKFRSTNPAPMFDSNVVEKTLEHIKTLCNMDREEAMNMLEKQCGRYTRGKHKGELRGYVAVTYCVEGGWLRTGASGTHGPEGRVVYPNTLTNLEICGFGGEELLKI